MKFFNGHRMGTDKLLIQLKKHIRKQIYSQLLVKFAESGDFDAAKKCLDEGAGCKTYSVTRALTFFTMCMRA